MKQTDRAIIDKELSILDFDNQLTKVVGGFLYFLTVFMN